MKFPRDVGSQDLVKRLSKLGYIKTRQQGSHIRLTTNLNGQHHITIPTHDPLKIGTLNSILKDISMHFNLSKEELTNKIFSD